VPAVAEITPEASRVLDLHIEALGGREAVDAVRSVHGIGKVSAFGLEGEISTWTAYPDRRASQTAVGPLSVQQGDDGKRAWRTDASGKLLELDGQDLEAARSSTWFDNKRWLATDQGGGTVRMAADEEQSDSYDVLEVVSPAGEMRRVWFEKATHLVKQVRTESGGRVALILLSDYTAFNGVLFPMTAETTIMGQSNAISVSFDSLVINSDIPDDQFAPPGEDLEGIRYLKTPGEATLGFDYSTRHIWLQVSVNGEPPADFIFDTGASITVLDSAYAAAIGVKSEGQMRGQGAGGSGGASLAKLRSLKVDGADGDGVETSNLEVAVLSINPSLQPFFWKPCAGVLGFNFINRFVSEIDYDTKTLVLHDAETFEYDGPGEAIPMTLAGTAPAVRMKVDGRYEGEFRVDVGSSATVDFHSPYVKEHGLMGKAGRTVAVTSGGFGGAFTSHVGRMKRIDLGSFSWKKPLVSLSGATEGALANPDYAGNIGNRLLERFKCTFDYERRVLWLEPGADYERPDAFTMTGLQIGKYDEGFKIIQVIEDSPADKAGIRAGEVVKSVDGRAMSEWPRAELTELFETGKKGRKVAFTLDRDGIPEDVTIVLRAVI
jgi:hypothetical protein